MKRADGTIIRKFPEILAEFEFLEQVDRKSFEQQQYEHPCLKNAVGYALQRSSLNDEEWEAIKSHPRLGANIIGNVPNLVPCVSGILYHHEKWDGTGYPEGLKGEAIPADARILAIADAFAAMTSARPYRDALCDEKVIKQLEQGAGEQFDPRLVEVFIGVIKASLPEKVKAAKEPPSGKANP